MDDRLVVVPSINENHPMKIQSSFSRQKRWMYNSILIKKKILETEKSSESNDFLGVLQTLVFLWNGSGAVAQG